MRDKYIVNIIHGNNPPNQASNFIDLDYGLWIMDYGLWIMDYGLWYISMVSFIFRLVLLIFGYTR
jgi:hypothetical protein